MLQLVTLTHYEVMKFEWTYISLFTLYICNYLTEKLGKLKIQFITHLVTKINKISISGLKYSKF